ncbi:MAG: GNAT family N-acetyltransferase [Pyrinomonadaceae bacterium]
MIPKEQTIHQNLSLRPSEVADETFLETVYAEMRRSELAVLNWSREQENDFFKMQFRLQNQAYKMQFPDADYLVVELDKMPIGSLIVERAGEIRLVNIAVLPEFRSRGIGAFLLKHLQAEAQAANKPLTLKVLKTNDRAANFYNRCGFAVTGSDEFYLAMQWQNYRNEIV